MPRRWPLSSRCTPKVIKVHYLGFLDEPAQQAIFDSQCLSAGAMLSFDVKGGEPEAFRFLNALKLVNSL